MKTQLVLCSHGELANGLVSAAEMILGPIDDLLVYGLMPGVAPDVWREEVRAGFIAAQERGAERFLVLADLFGGSPCSTLVPLMHDFDMDIVTGANLGMLLEVASNICDEDADLAQLAADVHSTSCMVLRAEAFRG